MALLVAPSAQASWIRKRKPEPQVCLGYPGADFHVTSECDTYKRCLMVRERLLKCISSHLIQIVRAAASTSGHSKGLAGSSSSEHGVCKAQSQASSTCSRQERAPACASADSAHGRWHETLA